MKRRRNPAFGTQPHIEPLPPFAQSAVEFINAALTDVSQGGGFAKCCKCGRAFRSPAEYRFNAKGQPICRRFCRETR